MQVKDLMCCGNCNYFDSVENWCTLFFLEKPKALCEHWRFDNRTYMDREIDSEHYEKKVDNSCLKV